MLTTILGGHIRPDFYGRIPTYVESFGAEVGEELARYEIANLQSLKKIIKEENIDCDFVLTRTCTAFTNQEDADRSKLAYNNLAELEYMDDVQFTDGVAAEGVSIQSFSI